MDYEKIEYVIILSTMIILIILFGGSSPYSKNQIEYQTKNYEYINTLTNFEKKLIKDHNSQNFNVLDSGTEYKCLNKKKFYKSLIPNMIDIFFVKLQSKQYFNVNKYRNEKKNNFSNVQHVMVLYNIYDVSNNLELLINIKNGKGYFYGITKKISIFDVYPIFNNSDKTCEFTIIILKKAYWFC